MKEIFRLEVKHEDKTYGPFNGHLLDDNYNICYFLDEYGSYDLPGPFADGMDYQEFDEKVVNGDHKVGCKSLEQLFLWFPEPVIKKAYASGYKISKYTCENESTIDCKHQVVYNPNTAQHHSDYTITEIIDMLEEIQNV